MDYYSTEQICSYIHADPVQVTGLVRDLGLSVADIKYIPETDITYEQD